MHAHASCLSHQSVGSNASLDEHTSETSTPPSSLPTSPLPKTPIDDVIDWPPSMKGVNGHEPQLPFTFPQLAPNVTPGVVANADTQTPDSWIRRNPELIRLTGKHPFNAEPPLQQLMASGFFTPAHLHFVRNHGAVPRVDEETLRTWTIRVHGLVSHKVTFTLQELNWLFETVTLPVTLVCAGNRRKEQNVVRKSLGFDWGSAGLSTALWTGVYLADVLDHVKPLHGQAKYVIFEGADVLPNGPYGTSQRLSLAANRDKGMLIAWAMNGLPLEPDHGFPIRVVIPGQIGGRSVKWLRSIEVASYESNHHDNKVLPRHLSPDRARAEPAWWYDPGYVITELSVNSAITSPAHGETLDVSQKELESGDRMYTLRGYAYSGGGRRVNRCEISLDEGVTWFLCKIEYPEDQFRRMVYNDEVLGTLDLTGSDNSFCWCFWSANVPVGRLVKANVIELFAMDESMNMQPRDMYLNATSMLNNWLFRVAVLGSEIEAGTRLRFEHPAPVGTQQSGWMERLKSEGQNVLQPRFSPIPGQVGLKVTAGLAEVSMIGPDVTRKISHEELVTHDKTQPWFVVRGEVYDGTPFLNAHPGGPDSILLVAGEDATDDFIAIHSADGRAKLAQVCLYGLIFQADDSTSACFQHHIGTLANSTTSIKSETIGCIEDENMPFLQPKVWRRSKLLAITRVNHNSCVFRFALDNNTRTLELPCGQHVYIRLRHNRTGELIQRAYTPISPQSAVDFIDFLIKLYRPTDRFPSGGKMSGALEQLVVGDEIEIKGPFGSFEWTNLGSYRWRNISRNVNEVGMVCAGSGVTPIFQVLRCIMHDEQDTETRVWVISANRTEDDILLRAEFDDILVHMGSNRLRIHHILTHPTDDWSGGSGRIDDLVLLTHLPGPSATGIVLACGPVGMIDETIRPALQRTGWDVDTCLVVF
ncbi:nitrate reductase [Vararia minispora EC-137]|uniref:Nitrate reductase n=1 Tax=Vararia minispora EC-137 TaxID=1314806 RepID=A0ACB8QVH6_9AGAM|nr:nitrate reductase [Vararia minispora EC-137]